MILFVLGGLFSLLLRRTAKLFNYLHLFFTPASVGVLHFMALLPLKQHYVFSNQT